MSARIGLVALSLLATACGGGAGVRDEGIAPVVAPASHVVRLWFIRPGGRVGVESDLAPVIRHFHVDRNHLLRRDLLLALAEGPSQQERIAGYRTVLGCCDWTVNERGSTVAVRGGSLGGFRAVGSTEVAPWIELAGAAQIQRSFAGIRGVRAVLVWGLTQARVRTTLATLADRSVTQPVVRGSCAAARATRKPISIAQVRQTGDGAILRVRAPTAVSIQFSSLLLQAPVAATVAPCGIVDVTFPPPWPRGATADAAEKFELLVSPLFAPSRYGPVSMTFLARVRPAFP